MYHSYIDRIDHLLVAFFCMHEQAQCLSSRSQDGASTPASPSAAALRKAVESAVAVETLVEETVKAELQEAAADAEQLAKVEEPLQQAAENAAAVESLVEETVQAKLEEAAAAAETHAVAEKTNDVEAKVEGADA